MQQLQHLLSRELRTSRSDIAEGSARIVLDEEYLPEVLYELGSKNPRYDASSLLPVGYGLGSGIDKWDKEQDNPSFLRRIFVHAFPEVFTPLGFSLRNLVAVRANEHVIMEDTFLHELQHYVDGRAGLFGYKNKTQELLYDYACDKAREVTISSFGAGLTMLCTAGIAHKKEAGKPQAIATGGLGVLGVAATSAMAFHLGYSRSPMDVRARAAEQRYDLLDVIVDFQVDSL